MRQLRVGAVIRRGAGRFAIESLVFAGAVMLATAVAASALAMMQARPAWPAPQATGAPTASALPKAELFHERAGDHDYVLAVITPPAAAPAWPVRELVLVIDTSRAMSGPALEQSKAALRLALNGLRADDHFNIVGFAERPHALFEAPRQATLGNLAAAGRFVSGLGIGGDGQALPALKAALGGVKPGDHRLRQIVFVTAAAIAAPAPLIAEVAAQRGRSRLYLVGIGPATDPGVLRRLAELGRGAFLTAPSAHAAFPVLRDLIVTLARPMVTELRAQWPPGLRIDAAPHLLPDILAGQPLTLAAQTSSLKGDLLIDGRLGDGRWEARLKLSDARPRAGVARLWARRKIASLEARRYAGQDADAVAAAVQEVARAHALANAPMRAAADDGAGTLSGGVPADSFELGDGPLVRPAASTDRSELSMAPRSNGVPAGAGAFAAYWALISDRMAAIVFLVLMFAGMCTLTLSFWRHLRREYASPRRMGWRI